MTTLRLLILHCSLEKEGSAKFARRRIVQTDSRGEFSRSGEERDALSENPAPA